jgi:CheY-like chemotaxis protein
VAKILIAEDEKSISDLIKLNLELVGHECSQVFDGEKALNEAIKKDTEQRKARLEKQLMELEKNQAERAQNLLKKVKSGEFKLPAGKREGQERKAPREGKERRGGKREKAEK